MPSWPTGKSLECMTPGKIFAVIQKLSISISEGKKKSHKTVQCFFFSQILQIINIWSK